MKTKVKNLLDELVGGSYTENKNVGVDIFDSPFICDFLVSRSNGSDLCLLVKCLEPEEEEIFPYLLESIAISSYKFVVIVGGDSVSPEAKDWLESQSNADPNSNLNSNLEGVFWLDEFEIWAKNNL